MNEPATVERELRYRVVGLLYTGRVRAGDRLPSIRQLAQETGNDHRAIADAYRTLEREGLVEIRPGSGVYVAAERDDAVLSERVSWIAQVLLQGWGRRFSRGQTGELLSSCTSSHLTCALVESNEDHMVAFGAELEEDFGLEVVPVTIEPEEEDPSRVVGRLDGADLVATTIFHAKVVRIAARELERPFVTLKFHGELAAEIGRMLERNPLTAVVADPRVVARAQGYFSVTSHRGRARLVTVDELEHEELDLNDPSVVVSRAARRRLGMEEYHLLPPPSAVVSEASARDLYEAIVRVSLQQAHARGAGHP